MTGRLARRLSLLLFTAALLASRGCGLASKPLHHDESLFGYYSYYFAATGYYEYDPVLHGPLLIELTAGVFRLLGDSDLTLRLVPLVCGLLLFSLLLALRPWLGRKGTSLALLLLLVSPNLCYYSRFLRNDVLFLMLTLANLVAIAYALRSNRAWPLVLWPISFALLLSTKENIVFLAASQVGFALLWIALDDRRIAERHAAGEPRVLTAGERGVHALKLLNVSLILWCIVAWVYALYIRPRMHLGHWALPLWLIGVPTTAIFLDAIMRATRRNPDGVGLISRLYERFHCDRYWWIAGFALMVAVLYFCYSICLSQPQPLLSLAGRAVGYWWGEHASERLGGPFHSYAPQLLLYEIPALGIVLLALVRDWMQNARARRMELGLWLMVGLAVGASVLWSLAPRPGEESVVIQGPLSWSAYEWLSRQLDSHWSYLHLRTIGELFWAASVAYWGMIWTVRSVRRGRLVRGWFIFWTATSYLFYGYAGEKVPWLALHVLLPLWLLAAVLWKEWSETCADRRRRGFVTALLWALLAWNAWQTFVLCFAHPTNPAEIAIFNHTRPSAQHHARELVDWIETGRVSEPSHVVVHGEASWPLTWYLRRSGDVRFESDVYLPSPTDEVVLGDPWMEGRSSMLRHDFRGTLFELRSSWVPPSIDYGQLLCLRPLVGEPDRAGERLRYRLANTVATLRALGRYVLFRHAYGWLPPAPGDEPFGVVSSMIWERERASPEPLLPPE